MIISTPNCNTNLGVEHVMIVSLIPLNNIFENKKNHRLVYKI